MSLSLPDNIWLSLAQEIEKVEGAFVLKNLSAHEYNVLGVKMYELRKQKINIAVQIYPLLFKKYRVNKTPTFVIQDGEQFYKTSAATSLQEGLEQIENEKNKNLCKSLREKLNYRNKRSKY